MWDFVGVPLATLPVPRLTSFYTRFKNEEGEESVAVSVLLPGPAIGRFAKIASWLNKDNGGSYSLDFTLVVANLLQLCTKSGWSGSSGAPSTRSGGCRRKASQGFRCNFRFY